MQLVISDLNKTYKNGVKALDHLNLELGTGMFGLLGPNGAGKSTLMRTIATLQKPDSGSISFEGIDVLEDNMSLRKVLGYLPQEFGVYPRESAENLLDYFACLKGISSSKDRKMIISEVLELTNLTDVRKNHVDSYSGGMKQRFGIAQLLLNKPKLIIVDEPTAGLDPAERVRFLNVLREIATENTVIFSTHIVDDVNDLCQDLAIMNEGKILMHTEPSTAIQAIKNKIWTCDIDRAELRKMEAQYPLIYTNYNNKGGLTIKAYSNIQPSVEFLPTEANLEDVYFVTLQNLQK